MRFCEASGRLDAEFNPFTNEYIGEILEAVAVAWARMRHPKPSEIEDRITFKLAGRLLNDLYFRDLPYDIVPQHWLLGIDGHRLGRLDLHFKHRQSQRDYFAFEAKRLHVAYPGGTTSPEYSIYAGDDGMGAFVEGQYSKGLPAAGMLGYVMDADAKKAWAGLVARIEAKRADLRLLAKSQLTESALKNLVASGLPGTLLGETQHTLTSNALRLFHLLLPVTQSPRKPILNSDSA